MTQARDEIRVIAAESLRAFARQAIEAGGVPGPEAELIADSLVEADLRGVHSHGLAVLPIYARGLKQGLVNPRPQVRVVSERGSVALLDGDRGLGQVASVAAMQLAVKKAQEHAMGAVSVRNSNHFGAAAYWAMMALPAGMIGFATTNASPIIAPWGGASRTVGNNPIAYAIPAGRERPLVLDFGMSVVAYGKVRVALHKGEKIPLGWATDAEGRPTEDAAKAMDGILLPVGGYKGYGLAVVMDALTGVLSGANFGLGVPAVGTVPALMHQDLGHFFWALDVSAFMPLEEFGRRMDKMIANIRKCKLAPGVERIYLPGEIEFENRERRVREGVPMAVGTLDRLQELAQELGLAGIEDGTH